MLLAGADSSGRSFYSVALVCVLLVSLFGFNGAVAEEVTEQKPAKEVVVDKADDTVIQASTAGLVGSPSATGMGQILKTIIGLVVVLVVIFFLAWAVKRYGPFTSSAMGQVKMVAGLSLGNRERVVVVNVGGKQLVLGVTPSNIQTLAELNEGERIDVPATQSVEAGGEFAKRLKQAIGGREQA